jgi:hypothetical protein
MLADIHKMTLTRFTKAHSTRLTGAALVLLVVIGAVSPTGAAARDSIALNTLNSAVDNSPKRKVLQPSVPPQTYVEVIVKACPQMESFLEPKDQGHSTIATDPRGSLGGLLKRSAVGGVMDARHKAA